LPVWSHACLNCLPQAGWTNGWTSTRTLPVCLPPLKVSSRSCPARPHTGRLPCRLCSAPTWRCATPVWRSCLTPRTAAGATPSSTARSAARATPSRAACRLTGRTPRWPTSRCAPLVMPKCTTRSTGASMTRPRLARTAGRACRCSAPVVKPWLAMPSRRLGPCWPVAASWPCRGWAVFTCVAMHASLRRWHACASSNGAPPSLWR